VVEKSVVGEKGNCGVEGGGDVRVGIVAVEISTGDVVYGEFCDSFLRSALEAVLVNLSPAELLLGDPLSKQTEKVVLNDVMRQLGSYFGCVLRILLFYLFLCVVQWKLCVVA